MSLSRKTTFEDLSSELHISIFEYLNANDLIQSIFNLNQYFNQLLCDYHLLLHWTLIEDRNEIGTLSSAICLEQLKSLKCYDYHLIQFHNPNKLSCLLSLVVFKYAINIREEEVIDFILAIPQLKYCQIKLSQSHDQVDFVSPSYHKSQEPTSSNLKYLDIDSKFGVSFSYFHSHVLRCSPNLRYVNAYLSCDDGNHNTIYKPISDLVYLSKLTLKIRRAKLDHLKLLSQNTPNIESLKLDCLAGNSNESFMNAQKWFQLLSSWKNLKLLRIYVQSKNNIPYNHFPGIQQTFRSVPFLVERHVCPEYSFSGYNRRRIHFNAHYRKK
ncbi:unnamed protein product [Rotaria sp. Silwood2]|nr:unnamed protein product [Rotaria sp. Silwood2]CAF4206597.1 unnamed protein product [Rotaria sp. Silwood2]